MSVEETVGQVLGVSPSEITDATSNTTLPQWDSMAHITLIMQLESEYAVSLSTEEALRLTSVGAIKEYLREHGIT